MRRVLVDTGAWLAALFARDQYHARAAHALRELRAARVRFVVTDLILAELQRHLLFSAGPEQALTIVRTVLADPLLEEVFVNESLQAAAIGDWMQRFRDQPFTLTDAVSFAAMRAEGIEAAFTFDRHFRVAGFQTIGV